MRSGLRLVFALALVVVGGAAGFLASHLTQRYVSRPAPPPPAPVVSGPEPVKRPDPSLTAQNPLPAPRTIPTTVPPIDLPDLADRPHALSEWHGRPLLINFWATWCEPCRREIPLLESLRKDHRSEGLEIVGIAIDFRDAVRRYVHEMHIDYPVLVGEKDGLAAVAAFGMDSVLPFTVFVDPEGRIVTLKVGELHVDEADLILARMLDVRQGRLAFGAAQKAIADGIAELAAQRARDGARAH